MSARSARRLTVASLTTALLLTGCQLGGDDGADGADGSGGTSAAPGAGSGSDEDGNGARSDDGTDDDGEAVRADGPVEITIAAAGDILAHSRLNLTANRYAGSADGAFDYTPMFEDVASIISSADLALCHLETPLSPDNTGLSVPDTLSFNTPREMADALAGAGFDGCDFASNHTMDRGLEGVRATEQVLRDAGMGYTGPAGHEDRAGVAEVYAVDGVQVAHLAYTYTYPNAGVPTTDIPGEAPWLVEASWPSLGGDGIAEQAERARDGGADFVVVSMHWGDEYLATPNADQQALAEELLGSGAVDLILGTHVHVIQPCERINDRHVIYGLGNFLSNQSPDTHASLSAATQEGMVAMVTLSRDEDGTVSSAMEYQPTRVEITPAEMETGPHVVRPVSPDSHPETWERTTTTVDLLGGCDATAVHP